MGTNSVIDAQTFFEQLCDATTLQETAALGVLREFVLSPERLRSAGAFAKRGARYDTIYVPVVNSDAEATAALAQCVMWSKAPFDPIDELRIWDKLHLLAQACGLRGIAIIGDFLQLQLNPKVAPTATPWRP